MLRDELGLMFGRLRIRVLLIVLAAVPIGYAIGVHLSGHATGDAPPFVGQIPQNGVFAGLAGLTTTTPAVLPLIIAVVAGDAITGEADFGTLRSLLTAPISRGRLLIIKLTTVCVFALVASVLIAVAGLLAGAVLFHLGPVPTALGSDAPSPSTQLTGPALPLIIALGRLLVAALIAGVQLFGFAAIGVFLSTLTRIPLAATIAAGGVLGLSDAVQSATFLKPIRAAIPTNYWDGFTALFHSGQPLDDSGNAIVVSLIYVLVFSAAAWLKFRHADIAT
jgi:ABC-2 type transport system permease protein